MARPTDQVLLFLHIPKAAGTTFDDVIARQVPPRSIYQLDLNKGQASLAAYKQMPADQRRAYRLVTGHMPFGLHTSVPDRSTYISVLRDPVDRMVSYYYFVLASPQHYLYKRVTQNSLSLIEFVGRGLSREMDNGQTRVLAAENATPLPHGFGELTPDLLDTARHNLETHFAVVGLAERFNATLLLLRAKLGWSYHSLFYVHQNRTANRPALKTLAPEVIAVIRQRQQLDLAVYDFARQRFAQELAEHVPQVERETARLERWLRLYAAVYMFYRRARRALPPSLKRQAARWRSSDARRG